MIKKPYSRPNSTRFEARVSPFDFSSLELNLLSADSHLRHDSPFPLPSLPFPSSPLSFPSLPPPLFGMAVRPRFVIGLSLALGVSLLLLLSPASIKDSAASQFASSSSQWTSYGASYRGGKGEQMGPLLRGNSSDGLFGEWKKMERERKNERGREG